MLKPQPLHHHPSAPTANKTSKAPYGTVNMDLYSLTRSELDDIDRALGRRDENGVVSCYTRQVSEVLSLWKHITNLWENSPETSSGLEHLHLPSLIETVGLPWVMNIVSRTVEFDPDVSACLRVLSWSAKRSSNSGRG